MNNNRIFSKDDKNSNLDDVTDAATADATADDIYNVKLTFGCENLIGDLDGIKDEYYQEKKIMMTMKLIVIKFKVIQWPYQQQQQQQQQQY